MKKQLLILAIFLFNLSLTGNIEIRIAHKSEIDWINQQYDEVEFKHSNFDNEIIVIAQFNGNNAGLGRILKIADNTYELGGIYVFKEYRNQKIATKIIEFLLAQLKGDKTIFCIPFQSLTHFYQKFGFEKVTIFENIPQKVIEKYHWCIDSYKEKVALLTMNVKDCKSLIPIAL